MPHKMGKSLVLLEKEKDEDFGLRPFKFGGDCGP